MHTIIICAVIVVVVMLLIFAYSRKERLLNGGRRVVYHYVDWCPACKSMFPIWYQVKQSLAGNNTVVMVELNEDIAKTDGVREYPTIDMIDEFGTKRVYSGTANPANLRNWILAAQ